MSESEEIKHYGVPGMKWGKTKGSYNAMTSDQKRGIRESFKEKTNARIDAARGRVSSGESRREYKAAKNQYKQSKATETTKAGADRAKAVFQKSKNKYMADVRTANTTKYGKEYVASMIALGLFTSPAATVAIGVANGSSRQKIGTGSGREK